MSIKNLEALGRTYHGGAPPFKGAMLDDRYSAELVEDPSDWPKDRATFDGVHLDPPRRLVMTSKSIRLFRKVLAYDEIRRKPGRSKLAAPGTRRKRNGGHRTGRRSH